METSQLHISLSAEHVFDLFGLPVTNSILTTWCVLVFLVFTSVVGTSNLTIIPGTLQSVLEIAVDGLRGLFQTILHGKTAKYYPLLATFFIFIIFTNWSGLLPGVGTIGFHTFEEGHQSFVPLFRAGTADLNTTLALALIAVAVIQYAGLSTLKMNYIRRFFNFTNPINFFIGILEIISELSRIISFAFRLFGNIFAGEVLLTVIAFLVPLVIPLPFLGMELFVGFIQALVFSMLTTVFLSLATTQSEH